MTEMTKTATFIGVAFATVVLALITRPRPVGIEPDEQVGQALFADFKDPLTAKSLEIVKFDEELGERNVFRVKEEKNGVWVIPSHQGYPADAKDRVQNAATMFIDLNVVNVVSENKGDHPIFGVLEPEDRGLGDTGVGSLVRIQDEKDKNVVELIIGKEVKDAEGQRYVRLPSNDRVYTVEIDPDKLSTKFEDWIETDLLGLSTWDIENISLKDYSVDVARTRQGLAIENYDQRLSITVHREDSGDWALDEFLENHGQGLTPTSLLDGEELNKERLDTLRDSLDDLKIVDVERKPEGMGADLKADKGFLNDREGMTSLVQRGFYPVPVGDTEMDLWSSDGEVLINTKDGVQYVLRFGQVAGVERGDDEEGESESSLNRYLFVTTRVNAGQFPMPQLEPLPEGATSQAGNKDDEQANVEASTTESDAEAAVDAEEVEAETDAEIAADEQADEAEAEGDETEADVAVAEEADAEEAEEVLDDGDLDDEIARINRENQRKLDERQDKLETAQKKVSELNYRFADWYYVISEDVFKKLHLGRGDIIRVSEKAKKEGFGLDAFRDLEKQGVQPEDSESESN